MRQRWIKPVAMVCVVAMLLPTGCAWIEEHPSTVTGAGLGAAGGGLLGYLFGGGGHRGRRRAAAGGALLGALAGGAIGYYIDSQRRTAQQTNQAYNYQPTQGTRIELANVAATPSVVSPGGRVILEVTYAVMAPAEQQQIPLVETRTVTFAGTKVAELRSDVVRQPGTYTSQVPLDLPATTARGQYELTVTIAGAGTQLQRSAVFTVN